MKLEWHAPFDNGQYVFNYKLHLLVPKQAKGQLSKGDQVVVIQKVGTTSVVKVIAVA